MEFTESQIVEILREARIAPIKDVARKYNIAEGTIDAWRGKFGADDIKRLRHLKNEHARRQRLATKVEFNEPNLMLA